MRRCCSSLLVCISEHKRRRGTAQCTTYRAVYVARKGKPAEVNVRVHVQNGSVTAANHEDVDVDAAFDRWNTGDATREDGDAEVVDGPRLEGTTCASTT